jgi:hypothetical protein
MIAYVAQHALFQLVVTYLVEVLRNVGYPDLDVFKGSQSPGFESLDQCVYVGPVVLR